MDDIGRNEKGQTIFIRISNVMNKQTSNFDISQLFHFL